MQFAPSLAAPVSVRNKEKGPTVFVDPARNVEITWQGANDPNGGDIQYVPADVAVTNPNFIRQIDLGTLELVDAPEDVQAAIAQQRKFYGGREAKREADAIAAIDHSQSTPLVTFTVDEDGSVHQK